MGTYTNFIVDGYELVTSKRAVVAEVMTLFRESDRKVHRTRISEDESGDQLTRDRDGDFVDAVLYATSVESACQRLDIMGFTLERSRREYECIRNEELRELVAGMEGSSASGTANSVDEYYTDELNKLTLLTFDDYVASFKDILRHRIKWYDLERDQLAALDTTSQYILQDQHDEWFHFGFFCSDVRCFIRMALSLAPAEAEVFQDVSALVSGGYYDRTQPVCDDAIRSLVDRYPENAPRIVLTEGVSDADILKKALAVLFPHLLEYFTFFDFHGAKAGGGASQLISVVKAFAAAGIANRVIAVLDNDTAGREARRALRDVRLPKNLAIIHYPEREWMKRYPTLGPSGEVLLNVNGTAASIELYLGRDVLEQDGRLCPVQWAGYSQSLNAYQGELLDKAGPVERWRAKAAWCLADTSRVVEADWADLRAIWEKIFAAFPEADVLTSEEAS
ncbi:HEPN/Toprim-associated domain-containing protein [Pandoraea sputorum]|uniref:HEPN/Toprim-associated domain-containing protein n=1 Tax=Pandoraea sputorum TaxID=93222 RepID=UPI002AF6C54A|nr:HEPN/Toprim-associated domain-containing protein [Pandoraea sputorum]